MAKKLIIHPGFVLVLALVFLSACSPKIRTTSQWQSAIAVVDVPETWQELAAYNSETGIGYGISNDAHNLYIHLQIDKPETRTKMLRAGMELSIDTLGKKKGHCTIIFPEPGDRSLFSGAGAVRMGGGGIPPEGRRSSGGTQADRRGDQQELVRRMIEQNDRMRLSGFKNHPNGSLPLANDEGIKVHLEMDTVGRLFYRAIIPLNTFYKTPLTAADIKKDFSLLITINGIDMPRDQPAGMSRGAGNQGGGGMTGRPTGGRPTGGGMPGDMTQGRTAGNRPGGSPQSGDYQSMTKKETLNVAFTLSGS